MLDQAVIVSRDMGKPEDIAKLAERGAMMYRQVNKPEAASTLLDKAAKILEKDRPEDAKLARDIPRPEQSSGREDGEGDDMGGLCRFIY